MNVVLGYSFISILIAAVDVIIAGLGFAKKDRMGNLLGWICILAAVVDCAYLITIRSSDYLLHSIFASVYFVAISVLLNGLVIFVFYFTNSPGKELVRKPLYWMHLAYSYILIAAVMGMLIYAIIRFTIEYKTKYMLCTAATVIIVLVNAVFLFIPDVWVISRLDISVLLYSGAAIVYYWVCFAYPKQWLAGVLKNSIFDSLDLGVVLFGVDDQLVYYNEKIRSFMPNIKFNEGGTLDEFLKNAGKQFDPQVVNEFVQMVTEGDVNFDKDIFNIKPN